MHTSLELRWRFLPPNTTVSGVIASTHGDYEDNIRRVAGPVHQSKEVPVSAVETCSGTNVRRWFTRTGLTFIATAGEESAGRVSELSHLGVTVLAKQSNFLYYLPVCPALINYYKNISANSEVVGSIVTTVHIKTFFTLNNLLTSCFRTGNGVNKDTDESNSHCVRLQTEGSRQTGTITRWVETLQFTVYTITAPNAGGCE